MRKEIDPLNGWGKYVQSQDGVSTYKNYSDFLKSSPNKSHQIYRQEISIPMDNKLIMNISYFDGIAPMESAVPFVVLKYWILVYLRKFAEKMWSPMIFAFVGDQVNYPQNPTVMSEALDGVASTLALTRNYSYQAFPGNTRVEVHAPKTNGQLYIDTYNLMNEQIMYALYSNMSSKESSGVYKANEIADESIIQFYRIIRDKIEIALSMFYKECLNIKSKITFVWGELRTSQMETILHAIEIGLNGGIFKDAQERRIAMGKILPFLLDTTLTPEEIVKLDDQYITLKAPSQPGVTTVDAANDKNGDTDRNKPEISDHKQIDKKPRKI